MSRGRRIALAIWIILNAAVLALLVLEPTPLLAKEEPCSYSDLFQDFCSGPYIEPRELLAGVILANGVALAALGNDPETLIHRNQGFACLHVANSTI